MPNGNDSSSSGSSGGLIPAFMTQGQASQPTQPSQPTRPAGGGRSFSLRPELMKSVIHEESGGRANAVSPKGAIGLMQIMPATAAQYGINNPASLYNPQLNQQIGSRYLTDLLHRYHGNEFLALVAYNSGPGRVDKGQLLPQSVRYASRILGRAPRFGSYQGGDIATSTSPGAASPPQGLLSPLTPGQEPWYMRMAKSVEGGLGASEASAAEGPPADDSPHWESSDDSKPSASASPAATAPTDQPTPGQDQGIIPSFMTAPGPTPPAAAATNTAPPVSPPSGPQTTRPNLLQGGRVSFSAGPLHIQGAAPPTLAPTQKTQNAAIQHVSQMLDMMAKHYDDNIAPKEASFGEAPGQTAFNSPIETARGALNPLRHEHPGWSHALTGSYGDEDVNQFYMMQSAMLGVYLKGVLGARLTEGILKGPLSPMNPDLPLPLQRQHLEILRKQLPMIMNDVNNLRNQGNGEDAIADQIQSKYSDFYGGGASEDSESGD